MHVEMLPNQISFDLMIRLVDGVEKCLIVVK